VNDKVVDLDTAISLVHPGDAIHIVTNHSRWTAAARHLVRHWWGKDPEFTLVMLSLSSLGTLFFKGQLVKKVITGYSGDVFPNFSPNPWFGDAYLRGDVEVEHWSFLTFLQRLEAAARGLPALVTGSLVDSSMADNDGFAYVDSPFGGKVGLLAPYAPDIALLHAPVADRHGNVALNAPSLEGVWGALAARRGAIVTVEKIVDDIRPWSHLVQIPAHQVAALVEAPMGAHPGGLFARDTPVEPYGEDLDFWSDVAGVSRSDDFDHWIDEWVLAPATQDEYLSKLGQKRITALRAKADPDSWKADAQANPPDLEAPIGSWERAAVYGARHLASQVVLHDADAVLAGAGVANLATWLGVRLAREQGTDVALTAELGLWDYEPTPADPFVFNHRSFPTATMLTDSDRVLGLLVGSPQTTLLACLGAAQIDVNGNINSTVIPDKAFLVGSGGGNDVASRADSIVVVATLTPRRTLSEVPYITSPGKHVHSFATDLGIFEKDEHDRFELTHIAPGDGSIQERITTIEQLCGWDLRVAKDLKELAPPHASEIEALRTWDPQGRFLRPDAS